MRIDRAIEAARDGVRLLAAEVQRLESLVESDAHDAKHFRVVLRRSATVSAHATAVLTTLADGLGAAMETDERMAWAEGCQAGMDCLRPVEPQDAPVGANT